MKSCYLDNNGDNEELNSSKFMSPDPEHLRTLLAQVASKDVQAFQHLYSATAKKLLAVALRILRQRELAEEVLQESFSSIWHYASDYRSDLSAPMTWMTAVVRNKAYDVIRESSFAIFMNSDELDDAVLSEMVDTVATPVTALEFSREASALAVCMFELESKQRQVIVLAFFEDLSHSEIAYDLALPLGTVKTWIRRGLGHLQTGLKRQGILSSAG